MEKKLGNLLNKVGRNDDANYDLIVAVIARGFSDYVVAAARDAGATGATIIYGRGTSDYDKQVMGISLQPEREVVLVLVKKEIRVKVMKEIAEKTSLMEEGRGLCFSLPVTQVYGLKRAAEQKKEQIQKAKELEKANKVSAKSGAELKQTNETKTAK